MTLNRRGCRSLQLPLAIFFYLRLVVFISQPLLASSHDLEYGHRGHAHSHLHAVAGKRSTELLADQAHLLSSVMASSSTSNQNDYTCGPNKPCYNGACCGQDGWCGYGPDFCEDGCQSNCDAKAECGRFAANPGQTCPLNVCCSTHGFCGTTTDFCTGGCQSNCATPKPNSSPSDPQKMVIGYWETWNMDKPCGTMEPGEIPVHLLTHLFVSFAYINDKFEITNMDGIDPEIYKTIVNVKARNPSLKVVIALGGWTFSDPGPWQDIFPNMASTQANRATFIKNLMGFMSEYGYDGVDFDWEYPGADDRGGREGDGENYTLLLKELREAIDASGRSYISTFTAPSSYWYLRHFDLKGMEESVDWINLMSYDLHGVWDSDNPIGNQVLSHTNLTEIDLALDLFWRVGVDPGNVVLGLGFYGRSFELETSRCWKPGCKFQGPGAPGPCSRTPGILAYNEIMDLLERTGGEAYFDEAAAARYMVYDGHSWISFDDPTTFQLKIDYAARMGLRGLMIWAIDLDTSSLEALRTISGGGIIQGTNSPFTLVDLERLFPDDMLPQGDPETNWGMVTFGGTGGQDDPNQGGFGLILVTGDSHAVSSFKKREDRPEPLVFLDCPSDPTSQPHDKAQKARVACFSDDIKGCFRVMERGVEGTIVEMPDNCAPNELVRAISLTVSDDQVSLLNGRAPSSDVFDFVFDFKINHARRDTENTRIRIDYSNSVGYWDAAVDSIGIQYANNIDKRFFAPQYAQWRSMYEAESSSMGAPANEKSARITQKVDAPVFWNDLDGCDHGGDVFSQGMGVHIGGDINAKFLFGFTTLADISSGFKTREANGFIRVTGNSDLTYSVGGVGTLNMDRKHRVLPARSGPNTVRLLGNTMQAGKSGVTVIMSPYWGLTYGLGTWNDTSTQQTSPSGPYFDGKLTTRVKSDFGSFTVNFPPNPNDYQGSMNGERNIDQFQVSDDNRVFATSGEGGRIALTSSVSFGMKVRLDMNENRQDEAKEIADMSMNYNNMLMWKFYPSREGSSEICTDLNIFTNGLQNLKTDESNTLGWERKSTPYVVSDSRRPSDAGVCYTARPSMGEGLAWGITPTTKIDPTHFLEAGDSFGAARFNQLQCQDCLVCGDDGAENSRSRCCGCVNMNLVWGYLDIGSCPTCNPDDGRYPGGSAPLKRAVSAGPVDAVKQDITSDSAAAFLDRRVPGIATLLTKPVSVCGRHWVFGKHNRYPAFPAPYANPWEGIENGRWNDMPRYWGNKTRSCSDWSITRTQTHDTAWINAGGSMQQVRTKYQTEHVFEAQLLGDFFTEWLNKGAVRRQMPEPRNPQPKMACDVTARYIVRKITGAPWRIRGTPVSLLQLLHYELGNLDHLDRLTVLLSRPNRMKGAMFTGNEPSRSIAYKSMTPDEQLSTTKEMGLVFTYMNEPDVWAAFCATYEAIYDHLGDFDTWYMANGSGVTIPNLQREWREYIETALASLVNRTKRSFDAQYREAYSPQSWSANDPYATHWVSNRMQNRQLIRIRGTCRNMSAIRA